MTAPRIPAAALILVASALVLVPSLFTRDPWNPDEPRYAEVPREMVVLGDYLVPHLNGEPYPDKPPLFFWLAAALRHAGLGETSGRVVSLLATMGVLLVVYDLGRRLDSTATGLLAALITLTTALFLFITKFGVLDPLLTLWTTLAIACAVRAFDRGAGGSPRWWLGFYAASALGVLTKGPVALAVTGLVALSYGLVRRREVRKGGWWHLAGAGLLLALVGAWLVPAVIQGGEAYRNDILFHQTADRLVRSESHRKPFYFYLAWAPGFFFPWGLVLPLAVLSALRAARRERDAASALAASWFLVLFVFFSLVSGKRERYLLPLVPAAGLLCARYAVAVAKGVVAHPRWHAGLWRATFILLTVLAVGLGASALSPGPLARRFEADAAVLHELAEALTPALVAAALLASAAVVVACLYAVRLPRLGAGEFRRVAAGVAAALALSLAIDLAATPVLDRFKSGRDLVEEAGPYLTDAAEVFQFGADFSGVYNLYTGRVRLPVLGSAEELAAALRSEARVAAIVKERMLDDLGKGFPPFHVVARERVGHRRIAVITNWKH